MYNLGLYVGLFEILRDFMGLPGLYGLKYDSLIASVIAMYLCSYKLDGSVTYITPCTRTFIFLPRLYYFKGQAVVHDLDDMRLGWVEYSYKIKFLHIMTPCLDPP